ncbi:MAG TPA: ATP-binding protein [Dongiaceae bacterium]|nr:ATP-binding protein [Dongiaceae bacterium]
MRTRDGKERARIVRFILIGSLIIGVVFIFLLAIHDVTLLHGLRIRCFVAVGGIGYLSAVLITLQKQYLHTASWLLLLFYSGFATMTLLFWGINTPIGILATSFVIILSSVLFGSRLIIPVLVGVSCVLLIIQTVHSFRWFEPHTVEINTVATYWDVLTYIVVFIIFGILSLLSGRRTERALARAIDAEKTIRAQRNTLSAELKNESRRLREAQLKEVRHLYRFAAIGQSTAATLHELSNHLSVLNMDIDDLKQQHQNSKAITQAQDSIDAINLMVRQVRRKLESANESTPFKPATATHQIVSDFQEKFHRTHAILNYRHNQNTKRVTLHGDPAAWNQIMTILISNALEACQELSSPLVAVSLTKRRATLILAVRDNGLGVDPRVRPYLFNPVMSTKPNGMGVGLYIAKHLIETQFGGTIEYHYTDVEDPEQRGSFFTVSLPLTKKAPHLREDTEQLLSHMNR